MRVLVASWLGSTNLGDELLFRALSRRLQRLGATVAAISTDPEATTRVHGVAAVRDRDVHAVATAARQADLLVFGGGNLLQDATSRFNLPYHLGRVAAARRAGTPVAVVGIGAGPLTTASGRSFVRTALRPVNGVPLPIAVREVESAAVLARLGVGSRLAADLAFGPGVHGSETPTAVRDVVAVCLRPWAGGGRLPVAANWRRGLQDDQLVTDLAAALDDAIVTTGLPIELVAFQVGRDDVLHARIADRMRQADRVRQVTPSLDEVVPVVASARGVVSMRYHGGVAAALGGRPSLLIGYASKVHSLAADLGGAARIVGTGGRGGVEVAADLTSEIVRMVEESDQRAELAADALARLRQREHVNDEVLAAALERAAT